MGGKDRRLNIFVRSEFITRQQHSALPPVSFGVGRRFKFWFLSSEDVKVIIPQANPVEVRSWSSTACWVVHCLLCPPGRSEWVAHSHLDLTRIHDHLSGIHTIPFDAFFYCTHERHDERIFWFLPDGRPCLGVITNQDF